MASSVLFTRTLSMSLVLLLIFLHQIDIDFLSTPQTETVYIYILYTKIVQDEYNWCIQNVYKMYTKSIGTLFQQAFVYILYTKSKELMPAKCCIQNVYNNLLKCGMGYILYTNILYTFYIIHFVYLQNVYKNLSKYGIYFVYKHFAYISLHQFWSTKSVHHKHYA